MKEKALQTVTREETPEPPKQEAQTITPIKTQINYKRIMQGLFIVSTAIVLIPLYFCIAITKNLK